MESVWVNRIFREPEQRRGIRGSYNRQNEPTQVWATAQCLVAVFCNAALRSASPRRTTGARLRPYTDSPQRRTSTDPQVQRMGIFRSGAERDDNGGCRMGDPRSRPVSSRPDVLENGCGRDDFVVE